MALTREQLMSANERRSIEVATPTGTVRLGVMRAGERDAYLSGFINNPEAAEGRDLSFKYRLLVRCLLNPDGSRMFTDAETADVEALPSETVDCLVKAANELNGLTASAVEEQKNS